MLTQLRVFDLAHRALDQALQAARRTSDPLVGASVIVTLCWLLMRQGRLDEVQRLAVETA